MECLSIRSVAGMSRIVVNYSHGRGLIFDPEDYLKLRYEHRIVGNLVGIPASHPRNINQQGMPVILSPCEIKLLLEKHLIRLVSKNEALSEPPSEDQVQNYNEMVERQKVETRQPAIDKRMEAFKKHLPRILEGKRKKLLKSGVEEKDINLNAEQLLDDERKKLEQEKYDAIVQIPSKHLFHHDTSFDFNAADSLKYHVFESLWSRGGFITTGDAFGCDFLLYPGDPMYFHASHMVHVVKGSTYKRLDVKYLIRLCRLSVIVNKLCVIAYADQDSNDVHFETLEWEGNSNKGEIL